MYQAEIMAADILFVLQGSIAQWAHCCQATSCSHGEGKVHQLLAVHNVLLFCCRSVSLLVVVP